MKKLSVKENFIWNTTGCLLYQICQWLTTILVVTLSANYENSGYLAFAMATGNIFTAVATYNIRSFQVSDVKGVYSSHQYVGFRLATTGIAYVIFSIYTLIVSPDFTTKVVVFAYLLFKADEALSNVLYGIDQKGSRMDFIGISQGMRGLISIGLFSAGLAYTGNLVYAILMMYVGCAIVTFVYDFPHSNKIESTSPQLNRQVLIALLRKCLPLVASNLLLGLVATIARQSFGTQYGAQALGVYAAVATPCVIVQVLANYLYSPFLVPLAESWSRKEVNKMSTTIAKLLLGMVLAGTACTVFAYWFSDAGLTLIFGPSITESAWMIVPAMAAATLMAVAYFLCDLFIVVRSLKDAVVVAALPVVVCLATMTWAFSTYYMNGINIVIIVSFSVGIAYGLTRVRRLLRRNASTI